MNLNLASKIISLMDLTSLNENDSDDKIRKLCQSATTPYGAVAAVCVYPQFVATACSCLADTGIKIATVANFPHGDQSIESIIELVAQAIDDGADEIDVVIPYKRYLAGDKSSTIDLIGAVKAVDQSVTLKVILETGALDKPDIIAQASRDAMQAGADFLKTSTGKILVGATIAAAGIMLNEIKQFKSLTGKTVGFKASGGVKTAEQAMQYLDLAGNILGQDYLIADSFRFGASSLLQDVLNQT